jgi:hypothetical protein
MVMRQPNPAETNGICNQGKGGENDKNRTSSEPANRCQPSFAPLAGNCINIVSGYVSGTFGPFIGRKIAK